MPVNNPTPLDVAASIDRILRRNIQFPDQTFAVGTHAVTTLMRTLLGNAVGGNVVFDLPDATTCKGMAFLFAKIDISANTVTVNATGGQSINGTGSKVLGTQYDFLVIESDGANWIIFGNQITTPGGGGAVFYQLQKIVKTDGITTLNPVDGTLINFNVAVDGECSFWAAGRWSGNHIFYDSSLQFRIDGVDHAPQTSRIINGSGGDVVNSMSLSPHITLFLTAGPHTVELVAAEAGLALDASPAFPLTLSVLYPGASLDTAAPTPKAATFVIHPTPGVADFTTIEAGLAALVPLGGGMLLAREGGYTPPAGGYIVPNVPVVVRGCGKNTQIDLGAVGDPAFVCGFAQPFTLEDVDVTGDATNVDRRVVEVTAAALVSLNRVTGSNLRTPVSVPGAAAGEVHLDDCQFTLLDDVGSFFVDGNTNAKIHAKDVSCIGTNGAGGIAGDPFVVLYDSTLSAVNGVTVGADSVLTGCFFTGVAAETVTLGDRVKVTSCTFESVLVDVAGNGVKIAASRFAGTATQDRCVDVTAAITGPSIVGCEFFGCDVDHVRTACVDTIIQGCVFFDNGSLVRGVDVTATAFRAIISGNNFQFMTEAIQIACSNVVVVGNVGCKVTETGGANNNTYTANTGFAGSTLNVGISRVEDNNVVGPLAADITIDEFERTVLVDATAAARTATLPTAASAKYRKYTIKKWDASANTVTVEGDGAETIDGAANYVLTTQYEFVVVQSDGVEWWIVG